ncbi:MAG: transcriptional regulator BetI [Acidihalobacter sp.]|uniref:transcriptional regulator BetI n=1 Tax=Acidihalobacter sp. TaxID=1872108 RepID=UPI00307FB913
MPKVGMYAVRRRQLMEASVEVIARQGIEQATVVDIAQAAGLSPGLIRHYFGSKDDLLEATIRYLQKRLKRAVRERCEVASEPMAKVYAIIEGNFAPEQFEPQAVSAWLAFWSQSSTLRPNLLRVRRAHVGRLRDNLTYWLQRSVDRPRAQHVAQGLTAFIDGLWVAAALEGGVSSATASALAREYVERMLAA